MVSAENVMRAWSWRVEQRVDGAELAVEDFGAFVDLQREPEQAPVFERRLLGVTLQIDEGAEVYDGKAGNIHPLFNKP